MEPLPSIVDMRIWRSLHDLYELYWIKTRAATRTHDAFRNVRGNVSVFYSFYNMKHSPGRQELPEKLQVRFCILDTLAKIDDEAIKSISRTSPKMTAEEKAKTVELVAEFKKEVEAHRNQTIEEIFGLVRPFPKLRQSSDDQLRQAISKGWDELQKLAK